MSTRSFFNENVYLKHIIIIFRSTHHLIYQTIYNVIYYITLILFIFFSQLNRVDNLNISWINIMYKYYGLMTIILMAIETNLFMLTKSTQKKRYILN